MPTSHRSAAEQDLPAVEYPTVRVRVSYELEVPVPTAYQGSADTAELHVGDLLNRLPTTDHDQWYVPGTELTTYTAELAR